MPPVSAWLVRSSLVYLAIGVTLGAALLLQTGGWWSLGNGSLLRVHRELLVVGWLVQLALGVGLWILPPVRGVAIRERRARTIAGLLNGGVALFVAGATWIAAGAAGGAYLMVAGRGLEALAIVAFGLPLVRRPFR